MNEKSKITFSILAAFLGIATIVDAVFMFGVMEVYYPILLIIGAVLISAICIISIFKRKESISLIFFHFLKSEHTWGMGFRQRRV